MLATDGNESTELMHLLLSGTEPIWHDEEPVAAIYFLICNNEVVYIGQTIDVKRRIAEHCRTRIADPSYLDRTYGEKRIKFREGMRFDSARYLAVDGDMLDELERRFIAAFRPRHNRSAGGSGNFDSTSRLTRKYALPESERPRRR